MEGGEICMSSIDERIVQMRFNNDQFERGIATTTASLGKLKEKLNLDAVKNSLSTLNTGAKTVNLDHINNAVDNISSKFSALGATGLLVFANLANSAIQAGFQMAKSLTIGPIGAGYSDYEQKLTSVQTITAATGKSIEEVNTYFNELDTYADKTIYNLSDMTSAFAKFTNAGVDLDKSVPAIKGIANMTALAGQGAGAAQIAYYNLAQSISGGFLTRMDYKSLSLANIATKEWQGNLIKSAIAAGTLKKGTNGLYNIPGSKKAYTDATLFTDGLQEQWASTQVLLDVLGQYGDETTAIGAKAQAAAQDIKSFGMMIETLQAAVGTGWTGTFEIIIGDLEESKQLWTGITQTIGGFLDSMSEARNVLLQGWKDLGGRTVLIEAFGNVFKSLGDIFKAVGEAFSEIFPPTTAKQLMDFTNSFKDLSKKMLLTTDTFNNLKRTLRGLFSIFGIVWEIVKAVGSAFFDLLGFTTEGSSGILVFTAAIGDFIYGLHQAIKTGNNLGKFFSGIAGIIKIPLAIIKSFFITLVGLVDAISNIGTSSVGEMSDKLNERFKPLGDLGTSLTNVWLGVVKTFEKIGDFLKPLLDSISEGLKGIGTAILNSFTNANYDSILNTINTGLFGALIVLFNKFFNSGLVGIIDGGFVKSIRDVFGALTETLTVFQNELKAKTLLSIALAIGVIAASVIGLSMVDPEKLTSALTAMTFMMTQLFVALTLFTNIAAKKGFVKLPIIAASLGLLAIAVGILTSSVIRLAKLSWEELMKGLTGVTVLLLSIATVSQMIAPKVKGMIATGIALIAVAFAVKVLASAISDFAKLSWENIAKGLLGVGAVLTQISLFSKFASATKGGIKNAVGLVILAAAIKILASAVSDFGNMDVGKLMQGLQALGAVLLILTIFSKVASGGIKMIFVATGLVILGAAIKIFASALSDLGNMTWDELIRGLSGMALALGVIAIAMTMMPGNIIFTATGLVIVAAALTILAGALQTMGNMTWDQIGTGLTVLAGSLTILAIALMFMNGSIAGSIALIIAAGALAILAPVLLSFSKMNWEDIAKGLIFLAGSLAIIAGAGYLLIGALPGLLGLGAAAVLFGAGVLMAGLGVMLLATALVALGGATVIGTAALVTMVGALINLIPLFVTKVGEGLIQFLDVIGKSGESIFNAISTILLSLLQALSSIVEPLLNLIFDILTQLLAKIVEFTPKLVKAGFDIIMALLDGILEGLPKIISKAVDIVAALISGIGTNAAKIVTAGIEMVINFIDGVATGIKDNTQKFVDAGSKLFRAIVDGIAAAVRQGGADIRYAGETLGNALIDAAKASLGIQSPSKEFYKIGEYVTQGLVNAIDEGNSNVSSSATGLGDSAVNGINKSIAKIASVAINGMDMTPTIRPVLDLTDIEKNASSINSMLTPSTISVDTAYNQAASISAEQQANKAESEATQEQTSKAGDTNISFVQNNNSPKALSPAEIYRQTKNQISAAKGNIAAA
jgi:hypothetical protein